MIKTYKNDKENIGYSFPHAGPAKIRISDNASGMAYVGPAGDSNTAQTLTGVKKLHDNMKALLESAFENASNIDGVVLPSGMLAVGGKSFKNCGSMKTASSDGFERDAPGILYGLSSIGPNVFDKCASLHEIVVPPSISSVSQIDPNAFAGSALTCVIFLGIEFKQFADAGSRNWFGLTDDCLVATSDDKVIAVESGRTSDWSEVVEDETDEDISVPEPPEPPKPSSEFYYLRKKDDGQNYYESNLSVDDEDWRYGIVYEGFGRDESLDDRLCRYCDANDIPIVFYNGPASGTSIDKDAYMNLALVSPYIFVKDPTQKMLDYFGMDFGKLAGNGIWAAACCWKSKNIRFAVTNQYMFDIQNALIDYIPSIQFENDHFDVNYEDTMPVEVRYQSERFTPILPGHIYSVAGKTQEFTGLPQMNYHFNILEHMLRKTDELKVPLVVEVTAGGCSNCADFKAHVTNTDKFREFVKNSGYVFTVEYWSTGWPINGGPYEKLSTNVSGSGSQRTAVVKYAEPTHKKWCVFSGSQPMLFTHYTKPDGSVIDPYRDSDNKIHHAIMEASRFTTTDMLKAWLLEEFGETAPAPTPVPVPAGAFGIRKSDDVALESYYGGNFDTAVKAGKVGYGIEYVVDGKNANSFIEFIEKYDVPVIMDNCVDPCVTCGDTFDNPTSTSNWYLRRVASPFIYITQPQKNVLDYFGTSMAKQSIEYVWKSRGITHGKLADLLEYKPVRELVNSHSEIIEAKDLPIVLTYAGELMTPILPGHVYWKNFPSGAPKPTYINSDKYGWVQSTFDVLRTAIRKSDEFGAPLAIIRLCTIEKASKGSGTYIKNVLKTQAFADYAAASGYIWLIMISANKNKDYFINDGGALALADWTGNIISGKKIELYAYYAKKDIKPVLLDGAPAHAVEYGSEDFETLDWTASWFKKEFS